MNGLVLVCQFDRHLDGLVFRLNQKLGAGLVSKNLWYAVESESEHIDGLVALKHGNLKLYG